MTEETKIKEFLEDGACLQYRENETHFQLNCFLCTDLRQRLGIHRETGKWMCMNCSKHGGKLSTLKFAYEHKSNIKSKEEIKKTTEQEKCTLKSDMHLPFYKLIQNKKRKALSYLKSRKITVAAIKHFKIGSRSVFKNAEGDKYNAGEHIAIPYIVDGKCVCLKYRAIAPKDKKFKWRREKGGISALFNDSVIDNMDYDEIYVAEAEIDAMSLWCLGIKNVVSLTVGAKGFKQEWYERLLRFKKVYLVLDNDKAGQDGAKKLAKRLGLGRCYNVLLPDDIKDANEFIQKHDLKDFEMLVEKAKLFEIEDIVSSRSAAQELYDDMFNKKQEEQNQFKVKWSRLDNILGPRKGGYLWAIAGRAKTGKTTLAMNIIDYYISQKKDCFVYSCEMRPKALQLMLMKMKSGVMATPELATPLDFKAALAKLNLHRLQMYYPKQGDLEADKICDKIREVVQRYGTQVVVFDNIQFLCRGENENALIDEASQKFKLLAEELDILFIEIVQPKKTGSDKPLRMEDLKGSSSLYQDADILTFMHRKVSDENFLPEEEEESAEGYTSKSVGISVQGRYTAGGSTVLLLNGDRNLFLDRGKDFFSMLENSKKDAKRKRRTSKGL